MRSRLPGRTVRRTSGPATQGSPYGVQHRAEQRLLDRLLERATMHRAARSCRRGSSSLVRRAIRVSQRCNSAALAPSKAPCSASRSAPVLCAVLCAVLGAARRRARPPSFSIRRWVRGAPLDHLKCRPSQPRGRSTVCRTKHEAGRSPAWAAHASRTNHNQTVHSLSLTPLRCFQLALHSFAARSSLCTTVAVAETFGLRARCCPPGARR